MAVPTVPDINFTTGPSTLPDAGRLMYNGCTFSPLYETNVSGKCIKDDAQRTVKFMEYTITADGFVTLPAGASSTSNTMQTLRLLLTAQAGELFYQGRGNDITVNVVGGTQKDAAWGPIPELLEFQPLGGGRSAKVKWSVRVQIVEQGPAGLDPRDLGTGGRDREGTTSGGRGGSGSGGPASLSGTTIYGGPVTPGPARAFIRPPSPAPGGGGPAASLVPGRAGAAAGGGIPRLLQFNFEESTSFGEDGYCTLSMKGVLEIPLTRDPNQRTRTFTQTADLYRGEIERRVMRGIDLTRFRVTRRDFNLSRDKRTLNWNIQCEEKPYMDLPPNCTVARGSYSVRPAKAGMGMVQWMCTLRATYTVRADAPRRIAWFMFLNLLRLRMAQAALGVRTTTPATEGGEASGERRRRSADDIAFSINVPIIGIWRVITGTFDAPAPPRGSASTPSGPATGAGAAAAAAAGGGAGGGLGTTFTPHTALLMDFNVDEGLYLDSKTITFSATWKIVTVFSHILLASGLWTKVEGRDRNLWATTVRDISGVQSWYAGRMGPDVIVDFGGG